VDGLRVTEGERVASTGRTGRQIRVTTLMFQVLPDLRGRLIEAARSGDTITYAEAAKAAGNRYLPQGMGPILDVLAADCARRGEPRLDALVVAKSSGEVAHGFDGDAPKDRQACWDRWRPRHGRDDLPAH
jgi:hypothetical protein